ncbi:MAG: hypothetical protein U0V72_12205 [Cytophagales bacterium]
MNVEERTLEDNSDWIGDSRTLFTCQSKKFHHTSLEIILSIFVFFVLAFLIFIGIKKDISLFITLFFVFFNSIILVSLLSHFFSSKRVTIIGTEDGIFQFDKNNVNYFTWGYFYSVETREKYKSLLLKSILGKTETVKRSSDSIFQLHGRYFTRDEFQMNDIQNFVTIFDIIQKQISSPNIKLNKEFSVSKLIDSFYSQGPELGMLSSKNWEYQLYTDKIVAQTNDVKKEYLWKDFGGNVNIKPSHNFIEIKFINRIINADKQKFTSYPLAFTYENPKKFLRLFIGLQNMR